MPLRSESLKYLNKWLYDKNIDSNEALLQFCIVHSKVKKDNRISCENFKTHLFETMFYNGLSYEAITEAVKFYGIFFFIHDYKDNFKL